MIYFDTDYMVGAHPQVMERLVATNALHTVGYGFDEFTAQAKRTVLQACGLPEGEVYFMEGGTQANAVVIDRLLDHNDGVVAASTAHINVHEAGAIESNGHKVLTLPQVDGKLDASVLRGYLTDFYADDTHHYMVRPGMVYVSFPTELGTLYSRSELQAIRAVCDEYSIPLYIDGARLAYGLAASTDLTLKDIARLADVFYIGGTKCGALFGEAVVTRRPELLHRFVSVMKLHGATLAKGRLLGVQFEALFTQSLYEEIGRHAVRLAQQLKQGFVAQGYRLYIDSPTNQQFFVLPNEVIDRLRQQVSFELWGPRGERETPVRFVTDWATTEEDVAQCLACLKGKN
jgi:threonine aldolase